MDDFGVLSAFAHALPKLAAPGIVSRLLASPRLGGAGELGGIGAATGAVAGATSQGRKWYRDAREQGAGRGAALRQGVVGALGGAAAGAAIGAGAGAIGGAMLPGSAGARLTALGGPLGASARFGQRQVHALTGWTPQAGIQSIRGGAYGARTAASDAERRLGELVRGGSASPKAIGRAEKAVAAAGRGRDAAERAQEMGLTSVPGFARSLQRHGVVPTLRASAADQWHGGGSGALKAVMVGAPVLGTGAALLTPTTPGGPGRGERVGGELGGAIGGVLGSPMPIAGQAVLGGALGRAGRTIGRGIDRLRARSAPETS